MQKRSSFIQPYQESPENDGKLIIQSKFQIFSKGKTYSDINAKLYQNRVTFFIDNHQGQQNYAIEYCFKLSFEMLRSCSKQNPNWNIEDCYAIRFQKEKDYIEFRNPHEPSHLIIWRDFLSSKLNQRGFHEQFKVVKRLGEGAFANVFQMKSLETKKHYAVKGFLKLDVQYQEHGIESIIKEAEVMRLMNHPNLTKLYGVYETQNSIYLILELLAGGQLFDKLISKKMKSSEVRSIMRSLLNGISELHTQGFMHRDLKPENILFRNSQNYSCVIADFGLAERIDEPHPLFARCGTPGYVAPEIANLKDSTMRYGSSCDIFSLGVILHMLLIGKAPFGGNNPNEALQSNKSCKINFQSSIYAQLTSAQLDLLKRMLCKISEQRITAKEALDHQFFTKDSHKKQIAEGINQLSQTSQNIKKKVPKVKVKQNFGGFEQMQSPLLMTKNMGKKHQIVIKDDSCLKFKMGDSTVVMQQKEKQETVEFSQSPICPGKLKKLESRFKNKENKENFCA